MDHAFLRRFMTLLFCANRFDRPIIPKIKQPRSSIRITQKLIDILNSQIDTIMLGRRQREFLEENKIIVLFFYIYLE